MERKEKKKKTRKGGVETSKISFLDPKTLQRLKMPRITKRRKKFRIKSTPTESLALVY